nr:alpha-1,6-mannosyl-glycoprotein 4-beta-N-acetylglucosaminyltransferase-like [Cherax quadricarinatus]
MRLASGYFMEKRPSSLCEDCQVVVLVHNIVKDCPGYQWTRRINSLPMSSPPQHTLIQCLLPCLLSLHSNTRYLTIGISSVWRKDDYLTRTIDSILKETTEHERSDILIFLLLADADSNLRSQRALDLGVRYNNEIQTGLLRVLQPPPILYPSIDFTAIRRTYNDSVARVQWRTKQVLDFAFLFWYVWTRHPSTYYLVLEDDVLSAKHFVTAIKDFVTLHRNHHWISLQVGMLITHYFPSLLSSIFLYALIVCCVGIII